MAALSEGQEYMHSFDFKVHDNSIADQDRCAPERLLEEKLGMTIGLGEMSIPDYVYYGGFLQGEGLTEYILNFRRRMSTTTDSAIFWMYEDCWPATRSWTIVDYLRNRTPSFVPVKRAFAPIVVDIVSDGAGGFDIYGVNEYLTEQKLTLRYAAPLPTGEGEWTVKDIVLPANGSVVIAHLSADELREGCIPCAILEQNGEIIARRRFVAQPYQTLGLPKPEIRVEIADGVATYTADSFVFGVCLDLDGDDAALSDNFFDLFPGIPHRVNLGSKSGEVLYALFGQ
jgi:beta-mannosidase